MGFCGGLGWCLNGGFQSDLLEVNMCFQVGFWVSLMVVFRLVLRVVVGVVWGGDGWLEMAENWCCLC